MKKSAYLNNASNPKLAKAVLRQLGTEWKELIENISDYRNASNGVHGFIYYSDTVKFAKRNHLLILQELAELEADCGILKKPSPSDETKYFNWLAWFALEHIVSEIEDELTH